MGPLDYPLDTPLDSWTRPGAASASASDKRPWRWLARVAEGGKPSCSEAQIRERVSENEPAPAGEVAMGAGRLEGQWSEAMQRRPLHESVKAVNDTTTRQTRTLRLNRSPFSCGGRPSLSERSRSRTSAR
jgi:hypothetical protein